MCQLSLHEPLKAEEEGRRLRERRQKSIREIWSTAAEDSGDGSGEAVSQGMWAIPETGGDPGPEQGCGSPVL